MTPKLPLVPRLVLKAVGFLVSLACLSVAFALLLLFCLYWIIKQFFILLRYGPARLEHPMAFLTRILTYGARSKPYAATAKAKAGAGTDTGQRLS